MKLLTTIALACVCTSADAASGMVYGTVTDSDGQPVTIGSIKITVNGADAAPVPIDGLGDYGTTVTWPGAGVAICVVQTKSPGFVDQSKNINVSAGGNARADFALAIDPDYIFSNDFEGAG